MVKKYFKKHASVFGAPLVSTQCLINKRHDKAQKGCPCKIHRLFIPSENPMVKSESELFILDLLGESPEDLLLLRSLVIGRATKAKNDIT